MRATWRGGVASVDRSRVKTPLQPPPSRDRYRVDGKEGVNSTARLLSRMGQRSKTYTFAPACGQ